MPECGVMVGTVLPIRLEERLFGASPQVIVGRFDSDEQHVPVDMFAGSGWAPAREGLIHTRPVISSTLVKSQLGRGRVLAPATCQLNNWTEPLRMP
jgi:hypothetical protein